MSPHTLVVKRDHYKISVYLSGRTCIGIVDDVTLTAAYSRITKMNNYNSTFPKKGRANHFGSVGTCQANILERQLNQACRLLLKNYHCTLSPKDPDLNTGTPAGDWTFDKHTTFTSNSCLWKLVHLGRGTCSHPS
jgi:hypothetical protein